MELKTKIDKMKKRHAEALQIADDSPAITQSDRKMQRSNFDLARKMGSKDDDISPAEASFFQNQDLPSLRCSVIEAADGEGKAAG